MPDVIAPQAVPTITGSTDAGKNFGRVAWNARLRFRENESPANSSGTGFIGRADSEDMPDPERGKAGRARQAFVVVNLLYPKRTLYTYAVSENRLPPGFAVRDAVQ